MKGNRYSTTEGPKRESFLFFNEDEFPAIRTKERPFKKQGEAVTLFAVKFKQEN